MEINLNSSDEQILQQVRNNLNSALLPFIRLSVMRGKQKKGINISSKEPGYMTRKVMLVGHSLDVNQLQEKAKEVADIMQLIMKNRGQTSFNVEQKIAA